LPHFLDGIRSEIAQVDDSLQEEIRKRERWHIENERRRFNYLPFVFSFLKVLSQKGKLPELVEKAKKKQADRIAARKKSG
jgi:ubiquitin carboxyl-terminal hydrolase L5